MPYTTVLALIVAALTTVHCGSSAPAGPTTTLAVSSLSLTASSVAAGGTAQGVVSLTAAAPASGASISLSSSNAAVAAVQTPVVIQAGASSATFTVTTLAVGTATITASLNGSSRQSPMLTVSSTATLVSIAFLASSVVGGSSVSGTVTLSAGAPAGGAVVSLSAGDPATVPASVTVPEGLTTAAFTIRTRAVGGTISATITGSYGGASVSAVLDVTRPIVATASFGVTGPTETETCTLTDGGSTLDCTFNGSTSTAPGTIVAWDWSYGVATAFTRTTSGPVLTRPGVNCGLVPPPPLPPGDQWLTLTVTLTIHDDLGNVSTAGDRGARLFPQGTCGY